MNRRKCRMKFKRISAMLLALVICTGVFSTTAFAYSDESATTPTTEKAETVETAPEKTEEQTSEEVPYTVTVDEDGTVVRAVRDVVPNKRFREPRAVAVLERCAIPREVWFEEGDRIALGQYRRAAIAGKHAAPWSAENRLTN
jgi:hypothetical protein